ncbi:Lrp/AsnC family transcriptional regulator [Paenibacillus sp. MBLB4367]|uniref:Lrp/AsnC family transcriptional regulator n=1 Tax=Paenibacillus sp. MBLB4367 TaxID=3384767 RepID=UPI0039083126
MKLEDKKIISEYRTSFRMRELNRGTTTFILIKTVHCQELVDFCTEVREVTDLFRISGEYNYLMKVQTASVEELAEFQDSLARIGPSKSHICLKNILENRVIL